MLRPAKKQNKIGNKYNERKQKYFTHTNTHLHLEKE